jgi:hypothetical protein
MPKTKNKSKEDTMKKSAIYYLAQVAVLEMPLDSKTKLEVLRELIARQDLEAFCEREADKEAETHA